MEYAKDRLFYQMGGTTDPKNSEMMYIVDLRKDWKSYLWRYTPTDENMWMDYDRDQFIGAYKENGKIYLFSRYNEDLSREYAENTIGVDYNGESYVSETVFDEKTYDLLEMFVIKETGDTSEIVNRIVFEYDLPEPVTCSALRSAFEAPTENMLNATFVVDPGTKNEISKTFKIRVDSNIGYNLDDIENVEAYSDSKCEKPVTERWDRMSDISRYFKHVEEEK